MRSIPDAPRPSSSHRSHILTNSSASRVLFARTLSLLHPSNTSTASASASPATTSSLSAHPPLAVPSPGHAPRPRSQHRQLQIEALLGISRRFADMQAVHSTRITERERERGSGAARDRDRAQDTAAAPRLDVSRFEFSLPSTSTAQSSSQPSLGAPRDSPSAVSPSDASSSPVLRLSCAQCGRVVCAAAAGVRHSDRSVAMTAVAAAMGTAGWTWDAKNDSIACFATDEEPGGLLLLPHHLPTNPTEPTRPSSSSSSTLSPGCQCTVREAACLGCGTSIARHIVSPCSSCASASSSTGGVRGIRGFRAAGNSEMRLGNGSMARGWRWFFPPPTVHPSDLLHPHHPRLITWADLRAARCGQTHVPGDGGSGAQGAAAAAGFTFPDTGAGVDGLGLVWDGMVKDGGEGAAGKGWKGEGGWR
ncbi:hypothetical protein M427DRAFT_38402 [Gonapodya prolifera JEL478]|uniref:Uncharacterized protein n=1 Tax=Gonapodya prolifera (strain JEL478) TaxID=1344416 RepID=A0A139A074_GONPJ|nr:hypothetical protein M427DRAFT_38402 [Gonapodya prolifera JEL478]|eukprot:KXS09763.1 hypothetical protein M427DRAFT_38402 [Gonapodya prolifera JEL478]